MPPLPLLSAPNVRLPRRPRRDGRLLIEVLIALVLLGVAASASASLVRANLALTDRIAFLAASRAVTRRVATELHVSSCTAASGAVHEGRTTISWAPSVSGPLVAQSLAAHGTAHPSGLEAPRSLSAELAGWCP